MPYIIEDVVMFNEVKGSLVNLNTEDEINLPPTASCILLMLFHSNGAPVERGEIMEKVRVKFGFDLSNNTLSQYISLLRKNLRNLGVQDDVIMTVPKVGFYISVDIKIEQNSSNFSESQKVTLLDGKQKNRSRFYFTMVFLSVLVSEAIILSLYAHNEPDMYPLVQRGKIGDCDLYFPINLDEVNFPNSVGSASKLAEKYLPCTPGSIFIYDIDAITFLNGTGKKYLSRCTGKPGDNSYAVCAEILFND